MAINPNYDVLSVTVKEKENLASLIISSPERVKSYIPNAVQKMLVDIYFNDNFTVDNPSSILDGEKSLLSKITGMSIEEVEDYKWSKISPELNDKILKNLDGFIDNFASYDDDQKEKSLIILVNVLAYNEDAMEIIDPDYFKQKK